MADDAIRRILADPRYHALIQRRSRTRLICFILAMVIYFGLMLTLAFWSGLLAVPIFAGAVLTVGVVVALLVELAAMVLVGVYVYICDRRFDPVLAAIVKDAHA